MGHIHTKAGQHDMTASAFIVRLDNDEPKLLLHQHKKLHKLLQPGGHVELHENPWQAVLHEVSEETGYELEQLKVFQPKNRIPRLSTAALHPQPICINTHDFPIEPPHLHTDVAYAFCADDAPDGSVANGESKDLYWFTINELEDIPTSKIVENVREICRYVLHEIIENWELVPIREFSS